MKINELFPTTLDNSLSTIDREIEDAKSILVGIPCYLKTKAYTPFIKNTDLLRILKNNVEDNSLLLPDVYYSMLKLLDIGDISCCDYDCIREDISTILNLKMINNKNVIFLGGEHTFTYFIVDAIEPDNLVIFDAHLDLKDSFLFDKFNHATYLRRLLEKNPSLNVYLIGVRSYDRDEKEYLNLIENVKMVDDRELEKISLNGVTHISIDLDVLDVKEFASTTYPEPYGLSFETFLHLLRKIGWKANVRTLDIMEFNPILTRLQDALLTVRLIYEACTILEYKKRI